MKKFIRGIYQLIGPGLSGRIAGLGIGKVLFNLINLRKKSIDIYSTSKQQIKLKLSKDEAWFFGITFLGIINPQETQIVESLLHEGDVFIDIGAYVDGWYSILAGKLVGNKGKVYSFEPHPAFFKRLKENIKLNSLTNIVCENSAILDKVSKTYLYEGEIKMTSSLVKVSDTQKKIAIKTIPLDLYVQKRGITKVNFIKIDVECFEMKVLRGAVKTLKLYKPILLIEVVDWNLRQAASSEKELISFLGKLKYQGWTITKEGRLIKYKEGRKRELFNMLFTPRLSNEK